jgi:hypothetical protein
MSDVLAFFRREAFEEARSPSSAAEPAQNNQI